MMPFSSIVAPCPSLNEFISLYTKPSLLNSLQLKYFDAHKLKLLKDLSLFYLRCTKFHEHAGKIPAAQAVTPERILSPYQKIRLGNMIISMQIQLFLTPDCKREGCPRTNLSSNHNCI